MTKLYSKDAESNSGHEQRIKIRRTSGLDRKYPYFNSSKLFCSWNDPTLNKILSRVKFLYFQACITTGSIIETGHILKKR